MKSVIDKPVIGGVAVSDTFVIQDNVANMSWSYRFAKGEDSFAAGDSMTGTASGMVMTVYASIPGVRVTRTTERAP